MMRSDYERVSDINLNKKWVVYASTIFTLLLTINEKYKIDKRYKDLEDYTDVVIALNIILILVYIALETRAAYIYSKAERHRALQYLDNSFDTNFAGKKIKNYFTQDKLNPGFYKLAVNCFENVFHSFNIARHMQSISFFKAGIVIIIFVFSAAVGEKGIIRSLVEAILPLALMQDAIRLSLFVGRLDTLLDKFKSFFSMIRMNGFQDCEPEAMRYVIEYESTLAWASLPLDSEIFMKYQDELAREWEELKAEYAI